MHSVDFNGFFHFVWPQLNSSNVPFSVVTNMQDNAAPYEMFACRLFGVHARPGSAPYLAGIHRSRLEMRAFLRSHLLRQWYTQNYDLLRSAGRRTNFITGDLRESACTQQIAMHPDLDSDVDPLTEGDIIAKVSPLPIGMGYSYISCDDLPKMDPIVSASALRPLLGRDLRILVTFGSSLMRDRRKTAMRELGSSHKLILPRVTMAQLFHRMGYHAFVATPASRGQDTYRFWETISVGAVPIVSAGPLDAFYSQLPCVIVAHWANITEAKLVEWRDAIVRRFGPRPREDATVSRLLSSSYYASRIVRGHPISRAPLPGARRAVVNHTCQMDRGGVLVQDRRLAIGCDS